MSAGPDELSATITALEQELLGAVYSANQPVMRALMLPDGLGVDARFGYATQASLIELITGVESKAWCMHSARVLTAGDDAAVITYTLEQDVVAHGRPEPKRVYATTVWVRRAKRWRALFYQETPFMFREGEHVSHPA